MGDGSRSRLSLEGIERTCGVLRPAGGQLSTAVRLGRASLGATPPPKKKRDAAHACGDYTATGAGAARCLLLRGVLYPKCDTRLGTPSQRDTARCLAPRLPPICNWPVRPHSGRLLRSLLARPSARRPLRRHRSKLSRPIETALQMPKVNRRARTNAEELRISQDKALFSQASVFMYRTRSVRAVN